LNESEVAELLRPHYDRLWRCGALPFIKYKEKYPDQPIHHPRTSASIVHDLMVHQARVEFDGVRGARILDLAHPYNRTFLEIRERALIRFKKLDENKQPRNYQTDFVRDYDEDNDLPGIPPKAHRLTLGYRLNPLRTEVLDVLITSYLGNRLEFDIELYIPDQKIISIAHADQIYSEAGEKRRLVRGRVTEQKKLRYEQK
jgi:hypothetical protein